MALVIQSEVLQNERLPQHSIISEVNINTRALNPSFPIQILHLVLLNS